MKYLLPLIMLALAASAHGAGGVFGTGIAPPGSSYGALAYDVKARAWAYAVKSPDPLRAKAAAAQLCGQDCAVFGPFERCGMVVTNDVDVAYGEGPDRAAAEVAAQGKCAQGGCRVAVWGCNQQSAVEGLGYRRDTTHRKNYGAISYDARSGAFGTVWDHDSFSGAAGLAKAYCGANCRVYVAQAGDCGVLAKGAGGSIVVGEGRDFKTAEAATLTKCGNGGCQVLTWFCNSPTP